ncbi:hypothetical protein ACSQ67_020677 [Phaseolus vulgaris]
MIQVFASSESCDVSLPGDNDPYWLAHMGDGHSVSFTVPQDREVKGMALCVVYSSTSEIIEPKHTIVLIVNYTKCTCQIHNHGTVISFNDEDWHGIMSNLGSGDKVCAERSGEEISRNAESQLCWCEGTYVIYADFLQADEVIGSLESAYLFLSK